jgi:MraZ protein
MEALFLGSAICAVDAGGRITLPEGFRETIARRGDDGAIVIGTHESDPCLTVYDRNFAQALLFDSERRRIADEGGAPEAHHARARRICGFVEETGCGADGVVAISPILRRRAHIGDRALIVAAGESFEIWDPGYALEHGDRSLRKLAELRLESLAA